MRRLSSRMAAVLVGLMVSSSMSIPAMAAGDKHFTLEELYSPDDDVRVDFDGEVPDLDWIDGLHWLEHRSAAEGEKDVSRRKVWTTVEARTGKAVPFFDHLALAAALTRLTGIGKEEALDLVHGDLQFSADHSQVLLHHANDLFLIEPAKGSARRLTNDPAEEVGAEFSPNGRFVSFVRNYNLFLLDLLSGGERQLTEGGGSELFMGRLDWVYQEEIYGRGNFKGYWWSPDSSSLAFLRLDESLVREFTVVDHVPVELDLEVSNYPKAGAPNPAVRLGVLPAVGGDTQWVDTTIYQPIEHLIVRVNWAPDSSRLVFQIQDREQRWLDLNSADPKTGRVERLLREEGPAFVQVLGEPIWLADGSYVWRSERTGFQHLYHYRGSKLLGALTEGEWEVRSLYGVDEHKGVVYFAGMLASPIAPNVYAVSLAGGTPQRLTPRSGSHAAKWSPDWSFFLDTWSDVNTPPRVSLHQADGKESRVVSANPADRLAEYALGLVEHLQVPARDGYLMEAMIIKPPGFDPSRRYPVLQYNYGGPHSPVVRDDWGGARYLWHQLLAQKGYVIWMCDNRSASGKGIAPTWQAYRRMGVLELADIEDGVSWLKQQTWVDPERIGIWGWSYGGFMAGYALTHSTSFRMGISGAPVTDWRYYDSVYTERYMQRPQNNEEGYDETSVVKAAADLHGDLMILHGTIDDNVHLQNTINLVYALQKAGKEFELMLYPRSRHGVREQELVYHLQRLMTDFVLRKL